jgi:hypothetical protein
MPRKRPISKCVSFDESLDIIGKMVDDEAEEVDIDYDPEEEEEEEEEYYKLGTHMLDDEEEEEEEEEEAGAQVLKLGAQIVADTDSDDDDEVPPTQECDKDEVGPSSETENEDNGPPIYLTLYVSESPLAGKRLHPNYRSIIDNRGRRSLIDLANIAPPRTYMRHVFTPSVRPRQARERINYIKDFLKFLNQDK